MALVAHQVAVDGPHGPLLLPTSLIAEPGEVTVVIGDPGPSSTALALVLGGRLPHDAGDVVLGHDADPRARRAHVALVDVPTVSEPEGGLPVRVVVGEALALAGLPSGRGDVAAFLTERDAADRAHDRWEHLDPAARTSWLAGIEARRDGVRALVLASPDRRGGDAHAWYATARALADTGLAVVVVATHASARLLGLTDTFEVGAA